MLPACLCVSGLCLRPPPGQQGWAVPAAGGHRAGPDCVQAGEGGELHLLLQPPGLEGMDRRTSGRAGNFGGI